MRWLIIIILILLPTVVQATDCCATAAWANGQYGDAYYVSDCQVMITTKSSSGEEYTTPPCTGTNEHKVDCEALLQTSPVDRKTISKANDLRDPKGTCQANYGAVVQPPAPFQPPELKIARPRLQIPLLTLKPFTTFKDPKEIVEGEKRYLIIDTLAVYLVALYKTLVGISGIIAGIMIVWAGFKWLTAAGSPERITDARHKIAGALVGVVLVLGSYVILNIINPELVFFKPLRIQLIEREQLEFDAGDIISETDQFPAEIVKPSWTHATFNCANPPPPAGVAPANAMLTFSCPKGVSGSITALPELKDPLCKAGALAAEQGYNLLITSSYRTFEKQVAIWCGTGKDKACFNTYPDTAQRKKYCAVPGFSNHGQGRALDVKLVKNGKELFQINSKKQCKVPKDAVETIANIFYQAHPLWVRYEAEIWHFEYNPKGVGQRGLFYGYPQKCGK